MPCLSSVEKTKGKEKNKPSELLGPLVSLNMKDECICNPPTTEI